MRTIGKAIKLAEHEAEILSAASTFYFTEMGLVKARDLRQLAGWLRELQYLRQMEKDRQEVETRSIFYRLFYREHLSRMVQRLRLQKDTPQRKFEKWNLSLAQVTEFMAELVTRAEDETRCNDACKSMYFCSKELGHSGGHGEEESGLGPW